MGVVIAIMNDTGILEFIIQHHLPHIKGPVLNLLQATGVLGDRQLIEWFPLSLQWTKRALQSPTEHDKYFKGRFWKLQPKPEKYFGSLGFTPDF